LNQTTLNEATVRDNIESGSHNKSIHNIKSFQTFRHYIVYKAPHGGTLFLNKMTWSWQHSRRCTVNILVRVAQRPSLVCIWITVPNLHWIHKQSHK